MTVDTTGGSSSNSGSWQGTVYAVKVVASASGGLDTLGIDVTTIGANLRLSVYSHNAVLDKPASLLGEVGDVAPGGTGFRDFAPSTLPNIGPVGTAYWIAFQAAGSALRVAYSGSSTRYSKYTKSYGAFDATWSAGSTEGSGSPYNDWHARMTYTIKTVTSTIDIDYVDAYEAVAA